MLLGKFESKEIYSFFYFYCIKYNNLLRLRWIYIFYLEMDSWLVWITLQLFV